MRPLLPASVLLSCLCVIVLAPAPRAQAAPRADAPAKEKAKNKEQDKDAKAKEKEKDKEKEQAAQASDKGAAGETGEDKPPTEKELLAAFHEMWSPSDPAARVAALMELGAASRGLADHGSSKLLAKTLGKGLVDDELEVQAAAVAQFDYGRHVESTIKLLADALQDLMQEIDSRLTRPDEESKQYVGRGSRLVGDASLILANYRDDRSSEALIDLLRSLHRNGAPGNNLSTRVVEPLATAVLNLGTRDGVEAAVRQTQSYVTTNQWQKAPAVNLHRALAEFAVRIGVAPPEFTDNFSVAWHEWFEKTADRFPESLGRLAEPPTTPPTRAMKDMRERPDDGSAPRQ
jgi:hypothetical protein